MFIGVTSFRFSLLTFKILTMPQIKKKRRACKTNLANARKARWANRTPGLFEPTADSPNDAQFTFENRIEVEPVVVKEEEEEDEIEMEVEDDNLEQEIDPLQPNGSNNDLSEQTGSNCHCLICGSLELDPRPLKGILPNKKRQTNQNPEQLEDDMRIIYLLKMIFQWSITELRYLMKHSNGQSPREWIHLCQSCRLLIFEIQTLEDRIRECRKKIQDKIMKMTSLSIGTMMMRRIRSLVNHQVRNARKFTAFIEGDRKAKELVEVEINRQRRIHEIFPGGTVRPCRPSSGYAPVNRCERTPPPSSVSSSSDVNYLDYRCQEDDGVGIDEAIDEIDEHDNKEVDCSLTKSKPPPHCNPNKNVYICPYCTSENFRDTTNAMNSVELFHHLIFHYDNPMQCSECKVFLPGDSTSLDNHWRQHHCEIQTTPETRCIKVQIKADAPLQAFTLSRKERQPQSSEDSSISILCSDCLRDEGIKLRFDLMEKFKIHQALEHPKIARLSCPLCPVMFTDDDQTKFAIDIDEHLKTVHKVCRLNLCEYCGRGVGVAKPSKVSEDTKAFHLLSWHSSLVKARYTCTSCLNEYTSLKEFVEHVKFTPNHAEVNWNTNAENLCNISSNFASATCGLCLGVDVDSSIMFRSIDEFWTHLNSSHSLDLNWNHDILNCTATATQIGPGPEVSRKYKCPNCPNLGNMDLDVFLVHLIFHWRRPNKCTECNLYLPFSTEVIDEHWKQQHPDLNSSTAVNKFRTVKFYPGYVFPCLKCSQKFKSFQDRNEHEISSGCCSLKMAPCSVCNEAFINSGEVRIHKAIDHPEIASLSCFYCEELFPAELQEGGQYLDCEALHRHIKEKEDHPKEKYHLFACDFCGEVIEDNLKYPRRIRNHVLKNHGKNMKAFSCHICSRTLDSLWNHIVNAHGKNCICETCGEEMRPQALAGHNLEKHDVVMEGHKLFSCQEEGCAYKTVSLNCWRNHFTVQHNKNREKTLKCLICEKAFFRIEHLKTHEERHRNKDARPHQCEICGNSFAVRNDLYIHKRLSHLNQKFPSTNRKRSKSKSNTTTEKTTTDLDTNANI